MTHETFTRSENVEGSSNRTFGLVFTALFAIIAVFPLFSGGGIQWWSLALALSFLIVALVFPKVLTPLNRAWTRFGLLLHKIVNPIVLGFLFYVVVTPLGLLMRLFGKDPLRLHWDRRGSTYWIERTPPGPKPETLSDQF